MRAGQCVPNCTEFTHPESEFIQLLDENITFGLVLSVASVQFSQEYGVDV